MAAHRERHLLSFQRIKTGATALNIDEIETFPDTVERQRKEGWNFNDMRLNTNSSVHAVHAEQETFSAQCWIEK